MNKINSHWDRGICPGGGFSSAASLCGGFPYVLQINELGYNAFVACSRLKKMFFKRGVSAGRILVAYYLAGSSAESFARKIFADSSCDFVGIRPKRPYPGEYGERIERYSCENRIGLLPEICGVPGRMEEYGEVYLLCPACLGFILPPLKSFLCMYDFSGKVLRLFCLCAPERPPDFALSVRRLCPWAAVEIYCARSANFAAHCPYSIRKP